MSRSKKIIRAAFRNDTFTRDKFVCLGCGERFTLEGLDAHHITPREQMPNGGYVSENGATLCVYGCHEKAEEWIKTGTGTKGYSPEELYEKISSSREKAWRKAEEL
tara:strand:+ start:484 stop:801 length:318 start_codon:yes stop_codon:yes gene_type:complete